MNCMPECDRLPVQVTNEQKYLSLILDGRLIQAPHIDFYAEKTKTN